MKKLELISKLFFTLIPVGFAIIAFFSGSTVQGILWLVLAQLIAIEHAIRSLK